MTPPHRKNLAQGDRGLYLSRAELLKGLMSHGRFQAQPGKGWAHSGKDPDRDPKSSLEKGMVTYVHPAQSIQIRVSMKKLLGERMVTLGPALPLREPLKRSGKEIHFHQLVQDGMIRIEPNQKTPGPGYIKIEGIIPTRGSAPRMGPAPSSGGRKIPLPSIDLGIIPYGGPVPQTIPGRIKPLRSPRVQPNPAIEGHKELGIIPRNRPLPPPR
jgi:hypothetical protein